MTSPPPMHPANGLFRFLLEMVALGGLGYRGWTLVPGDWLRTLLAIALPLAAAILWGTFAVPGDPSRSGNAPVVVPGGIRLILELAILGLGAWALGTAWRPVAGLAFAAAIALHYALSWDRILWLLRP